LLAWLYHFDSCTTEALYKDLQWTTSLAVSFFSNILHLGFSFSFLAVADGLLLLLAFCFFLHKKELLCLNLPAAAINPPEHCFSRFSRDFWLIRDAFS
jgi:hypothetical protein